MKSLIHYGAVLLSFVAVCLPLRGQSFSVTDSSYTSAKLFDSTSGYTIAGMAADNLGNVYYIESSTSGFGNTKLYKRSALGGYTTPTLLYDLGDAVNGGFVVFASGKLYFGENTNGNIYSINSDGTGTVDLLGSAPLNYDAAFSGGRLFLSYDAGSFNSRVSRFDLIADGSGGLMLGNEDVIVNANGDNYGSFEYAGGELYYGGSGYLSIKGLYQFSASEVSGAIGSGQLTLDAAHEWGATTRTGVGGIAFGSGTDLWETGTFSTSLLRFDRFNSGVSTIGNATGNSGLGKLDFAANTLFLTVNDSITFQSAIFKVAVPEPTTAAALLGGALVLVWRRRGFFRG